MSPRQQENRAIMEERFSRQQNMVMTPAGLEPEADCTGEGQQQL
jgi:hypothetical protein